MAMGSNANSRLSPSDVPSQRIAVKDCSSVAAECAVRKTHAASKLEQFNFFSGKAQMLIRKLRLGVSWQAGGGGSGSGLILSAYPPIRLWKTKLHNYKIANPKLDNQFVSSTIFTLLWDLFTIWLNIRPHLMQKNKSLTYCQTPALSSSRGTWPKRLYKICASAIFFNRTITLLRLLCTPVVLSDDGWHLLLTTDQQSYHNIYLPHLIAYSCYKMLFVVVLIICIPATCIKIHRHLQYIREVPYVTS